MITTSFAMAAFQAPGRPARPATPIQLRRDRRDAAIVRLARQGDSVESLADVFDLDPSSIRKILRTFGVKPGRKHGTRPA